jgi:hypothetical protein
MEATKTVWECRFVSHQVAQDVCHFHLHLLVFGEPAIQSGYPSMSNACFIAVLREIFVRGETNHVGAHLHGPENDVVLRGMVPFWFLGVKGQLVAAAANG